MSVTVVRIRATATAVKIAASTVGTILLGVLATVDGIWGGYAYDYFAEDYTVTTWP